MLLHFKHIKIYFYTNYHLQFYFTTLSKFRNESHLDLQRFNELLNIMKIRNPSPVESSNSLYSCSLEYRIPLNDSLCPISFTRTLIIRCRLLVDSLTARLRGNLGSESLVITM